MADNFKFIGILVLILSLFAGVIGLAVYKFKDCKKVGHTTLYCILDASK